MQDSFAGLPRAVHVPCVQARLPFLCHPSLVLNCSRTLCVPRALQDYPELYNRALESTKSTPAPNKTLVSDWGDSLKQCVLPPPPPCPPCARSLCL